MATPATTSVRSPPISRPRRPRNPPAELLTGGALGAVAGVAGAWVSTGAATVASSRPATPAAGDSSLGGSLHGATTWSAGAAPQPGQYLTASGSSCPHDSQYATASPPSVFLILSPALQRGKVVFPGFRFIQVGGSYVDIANKQLLGLPSAVWTKRNQSRPQPNNCGNFGLARATSVKPGMAHSLASRTCCTRRRPATPGRSAVRA